MSSTIVRFPAGDFRPVYAGEARASRIGSYLVGKVTGYDVNPYNGRVKVELSGNFVYIFDNKVQANNSKQVLVSMPLELCTKPATAGLLNTGVAGLVAGLGSVRLDAPTRIIIADTSNLPHFQNVFTKYIKPVGTWFYFKANVVPGYDPTPVPVITGTGNTLTPFLRLPVELRYMIWGLTAERVNGHGRYLTVQIKRTLTLKSNTVYANNSTLTKQQTISTWGASLLLPDSIGSEMIALRVCSESRKVFMDMNKEFIGMAAGTKVYFDRGFDIIYLGDIDLFHYYQCKQRRRAAIMPIRGMKNVVQLCIDTTPTTDHALSTRGMWLWKAITLNYKQQKAILEAGMSAVQKNSYDWQSETDSELTRLAVETTQKFFTCKETDFMKELNEWNVKVFRM